MAQDLRWLPQQAKDQSPTCTAVGGPQIDYLLALALADGRTSWVAAAKDPNYCVQATNGAFAAAANIGLEFAATMKTGRWPGLLPAPDQPCGTIGRYGQESRLVPVDPVALDICRTADGPFVKIAHLASGFSSLVEALNARRTLTSTNSCSMVPQDAGSVPAPEPAVVYALLFRYADGPSVAVRYQDRCSPAIDNSSLQATDDGHIMSLIESLVPARRTTTTSPSAAPASSKASPTG